MPKTFEVRCSGCGDTWETTEPATAYGRRLFGVNLTFIDGRPVLIVDECPDCDDDDQVGDVDGD